MTKLAWGKVGERFYESGIDRGVLYIDDVGHAWSGLVSVTETPTGGFPRPLYLDGFKYASVAAKEEFEATISAYSSPSAFAPCDGVSSMHNGLFATQQPRKPFGLSFRTKLGNDLEGLDHGYKIHLVYNALAAPSGRSNRTVDAQLRADAFSWSITTLPPKATGFRPTAHFVIDERSTPTDKLAEIEDILYGNDELNAKLPTVTELLAIFNV